MKQLSGACLRKPLEIILWSSIFIGDPVDGGNGAQKYSASLQYPIGMVHCGTDIINDVQCLSEDKAIE